ncbi:hypothetical protein AAG570_003445 [Ranatra chinensis]|uniref:Uncharacterized protein n=1 Tax=Ranatra chinensis TaxID=642074 RepID=A0ABD0YS88_9HEMI
MSEGLHDVQSQKDGELRVPISVASCLLFWKNMFLRVDAIFSLERLRVITAQLCSQAPKHVLPEQETRDDGNSWQHLGAGVGGRKTTFPLFPFFRELAQLRLLSPTGSFRAIASALELRPLPGTKNQDSARFASSKKLAPFLFDIQSQKGGKLHLPSSVVSCVLFLWNMFRRLDARQKMASKRRNMFHKNKTQETTEEGIWILHEASLLEEDICNSPILEHNSEGFQVGKQWLS